MTTHSASILVVDDVAANRLILERHLMRLGHRVVTAEHGCQALSILHAQPIDLILLDIMMPVMNGYEFLEALKTEFAGSYIPVVVISAISDVASVARCITLGAEDFLFKPIERVLLEARVEACLVRKRLYDREQAAYAAVQAANQAKSEFVSLISHELKNPLTGILGYADTMLLEIHGPLTEQQAGCLRAISSLSQLMNALLADLTDLSQIETGQLRLNPTAVSLDMAVAAAMVAVHKLIHKRGQRLTVELPDDLPYVLADNLRLIQILTNLLGNAAKYTPPGGALTLRARCRDPRSVEIAVQDTGIGISAEEQPRVFERFFRSSDDRARREPGTGLGLSITRLLVQLHGGEIWLESALGAGTTVFFTLLMADVELQKGLPSSPIPSSASASLF